MMIPPIIDSLSACSDPENSTLLRELQPALLARALVRLEECDLSRSRLTGHHYTALFSQIVEVKWSTLIGQNPSRHCALIG